MWPWDILFHSKFNWSFYLSVCVFLDGLLLCRYVVYCTSATVLEIGDSEILSLQTCLRRSLKLSRFDVLSSFIWKILVMCVKQFILCVKLLTRHAVEL